eukprot:Tbor_TRINITY_DN2429_c0_g1::TRINITY_DN2429_c0_g1_i1::g.2615::m.2615/K17065/DNM1L; dynamin 1-like protein
MSLNPMDELIGVVNDLRDAFVDLKMDVKMDLPQIAVIGSQSSGKSSVLENIVGKDFLPRGSGIVTKCPLVLQLAQLPKTSSEEWGEFLHKPGEKIFDFNEIKREIERRTEEITKSSNGVSSTPINLKIFSPNVLTLTLVDLPGLVMNATGDQPKDIDRQIEEMVTTYVQPSNTIMLAVSPGNADLATSAAIRLAKKIDPKGERTIGVLTKIDLMDRGTNALEMLEGKTIDIRMGFIGVVNRCQADINENKNIIAARKSEREFFLSHPAYSTIADRQGTEYLTKTLNKILLQHIQLRLPELKAHIDKLHSSTLKQQEALWMMDEGKMDPSAQLLYLIKTFSDSINKSIEGEVADSAKELVGGARIDYIFHECFAPYVMSMVGAKELTDDVIRLSIRNCSGMQSTLFPSDQVFITLVKQQIARLEEPSVKCVNFIFEELMKIVESCSNKVERFPTLRQRFVDISLELMKKFRQPTIQHVRTIIKAEQEYINLKHPVMQRAVVGILTKNQNDQGESANINGQKVSGPNGFRMSHMADVPRNIQIPTNVTAQETLQNSQIRDMVDAYFNICQQNVCDQVPKIITLLIIRQLCAELYPKLVQELYNEKLYTDLLSENKDLADKRRATISMMKCIKKAQEALSKVKDVI